MEHLHLTSTFAQAMARANAKRAVEGILSQFALPVRQSILFDVLAGYEVDAGAGPSPSAVGSEPSIRYETRVPVGYDALHEPGAGALWVGRAAPSPSPVEAGRQDDALASEEGQSELPSAPRTELLLGLLRDRPGVTIGDLALALYASDDDKTKSRIRSMLAALARQKRVRPGKRRGQWIAVDPSNQQRPLRIAQADPPGAEAGVSLLAMIRRVFSSGDTVLSSGEVTAALAPSVGSEQVRKSLHHLTTKGELVAAGSKGEKRYRRNPEFQPPA
jgi:hypothetical protein